VDAAEPRAPVSRRRRRWESITAALVAALPLLTIFFWLCLIYGWQAWGNPAPWLNSDEFERAQLARAIAATGHEAQRTVPHAFDSLYTYLIAPAWRIGDTSRAYGVAKAIGVVAMTAVVFPAYLLARLFVSPRWALFACVGAAVIPALAYSEMLLVEPLAYPTAALCFWLLAKALITRRFRWIAGAAGACLLAPLVRSQLAVIIPAAALATAVFWFLGEGGHRLRRNWTRWDWAGFIVLGICALSVIDVIASQHSDAWLRATQDYKGRMLRDGLWAAGALTIGLGVLPTIGGLAALVKPGREPWSRGQRVFTALAGSMLMGFGFYTAVKAAYVSTLGLTQLIERNLIYVSPLLFTGTAMVLAQRRARLTALVGAAALALYLVTTTPYHMDIPVFFDSPGLAILPGLNRAVALTPHGAKILLTVLALASAAVLVSIRFLPRVFASLLIATAAAFVLAWNAYGEISFARESHRYARSFVDTMPRPLDWVDRSVPSGTQVYYLGQSLDDGSDVLQLEFWNRTLQHIWSTDGTAPGPGITVVPQVTAPDGRLEPSAGVEYMVADYGVSPAGQVIAAKIHYGARGARRWALVHVTPPLRVRQTLEGVFHDGWGKPETALNQYSVSGNRPSLVRVEVSRTGAARLYPATVQLKLGTLAVAGGRPIIAKVLSTQRLHVANHLDHTFVFNAPRAPFRVETSVTPFVHSHDPRAGDPRSLGANVEYSVVRRSS
jgi:hypothetical protein